MLKPSAAKQLKKLPKQEARRILVKVYLLGEEPFPSGCQKLAGKTAYRIRVGSYRVIYEVREQELIVLITKVGHRKAIYR